jgi:hypothetical protein
MSLLSLGCRETLMRSLIYVTSCYDPLTSAATFIMVICDLGGGGGVGEEVKLHVALMKITYDVER